MEEFYNQVYSYGTELSKTGNKLLGDDTGRTITRTTRDGVTQITKGAFIPTGELTHAFMISSGLALCSKNKDVKAIGGGLLALLVFSYLIGR